MLIQVNGKQWNTAAASQVDAQAIADALELQTGARWMAVEGTKVGSAKWLAVPDNLPDDAPLLVWVPGRVQG